MMPKRPRRKLPSKDFLELAKTAWEVAEYTQADKLFQVAKRLEKKRSKKVFYRV